MSNKYIITHLYTGLKSNFSSISIDKKMKEGLSCYVVNIYEVDKHFSYTFNVYKMALDFYNSIIKQLE